MFSLPSKTEWKLVWCWCKPFSGHFVRQHIQFTGSNSRRAIPSHPLKHPFWLEHSLEYLLVWPWPSMNFCHFLLARSFYDKIVPPSPVSWSGSSSKNISNFGHCDLNWGGAEETQYHVTTTNLDLNSFICKLDKLGLEIWIWYSEMPDSSF